MKKRWMILDYGICFKEFMVCCILHNIMLTKMESRDSDVRVRKGELYQEMAFGCIVMTNSLMMKERVEHWPYYQDIEGISWPITFIIVLNKRSLSGDYFPNTEIVVRINAIRH